MTEEQEKSLFHIEVSRDHFMAYIHFKEGIERTDVTVKQIIGRSNEMGIVYGIKEEEKIQFFLDNLELYDYVIVIASGKPFTVGKDARNTYFGNFLYSHFPDDALSTCIPSLITST